MNPHSDLLRVSCIIAVYNGEAYLHEAIDSLLAQTYPSLEIVVVNDGSTDGTAEVMARYGSRIRSLHQENLGVSVARNSGVAMSTGTLLSFLDADDRLDPSKIAMQVAAFTADPQLDYCDCHAAFFWSPEISEEARQRDFRYPEPFWKTTVARHISSWLFRRELWDRLGGFSPALRYAEDIDWLSRARDLPMRQETLPHVLTHRRLHRNNVTARRRGEQAASLADTFKAHLVRIRSRTAK